MSPLYNGGKVTVQIDAQTESFGAGMKSAGAQITALQSKMELAGSRLRASATNMAAAIGAGFIGRMMQDAIAYAGRISDLSKKYGIAVEQLQAFERAGLASGVSIEEIGTAFKFLNVSITQALAGSKEEIAAFQRMGISIEDLKKKSPTQLFLDLARTIGRSSGGAQELADVIQLLGRAGDQVLPAMKDRFYEVATSAATAGRVIKKDVIDRLDAVGDKIDQLKSDSRVGASYLTDATLKLVAHVTAPLAAISSLWGSLTSMSSWRSGNPFGAALRAMKDGAMRGIINAYGLNPESESPTSTATPGVVPPLAPESTPGLSVGGVTGGSGGSGGTVPSDRYSIPTVDALARIGGYRGGFDSSKVERRAMLARVASIDANLRVLLAQAAD